MYDFSECHLGRCSGFVLCFQHYLTTRKRGWAICFEGCTRKKGLSNSLRASPCLGWWFLKGALQPYTSAPGCSNSSMSITGLNCSLISKWSEQALFRPWGHPRSLQRCGMLSVMSETQHWRRQPALSGCTGTLRTCLSSLSLLISVACLLVLQNSFFHLPLPQNFGTDSL